MSKRQKTGAANEADAGEVDCAELFALAKFKLSFVAGCPELNRIIGNPHPAEVVEKTFHDAYHGLFDATRDGKMKPEIKEQMEEFREAHFRLYESKRFGVVACKHAARANLAKAATLLESTLNETLHPDDAKVQSQVDEIVRLQKIVVDVCEHDQDSHIKWGGRLYDGTH